VLFLHYPRLVGVIPETWRQSLLGQAFKLVFLVTEVKDAPSGPANGFSDRSISASTPPLRFPQP
jgi:hypothetical protein